MPPLREAARQRLLAAFRRDLWITVVPALLLIAGAFALAFHYIEPASPRAVVIAAPTDEGGASWFARRYKEILARDGVAVEIRPTDGTEGTLKTLADPDSDVEAAIVQGGLDAGVKESVRALGSLAVMPLWIVYRGTDELTDPRDLRGKRVAVGAEHSATRALALKLLADNGVDKEPTVLLNLEARAAEPKLVAGEIDALVITAPAESPQVRKLATTAGNRLMSFARADAYARRLPYLKVVTLPRGVFDLARDLPPADVRLVATTSNLVAHEDLHPSIAYLLLRAAAEVHSRPGLLGHAHEFPALIEGDFAPSTEARRWYSTGAPLLQRLLPFWAADLVERLWVMLLPVVAVVLPVIRLVPPIYQWRVRRRIYKWYALLKRIEVDLDVKGHRDRETLLGMMRELDDLDAAMRSIPTPLPYSDSLYSFRGHIEFVRQRLRAQLDAPAQDAAAAGS